MAMPFERQLSTPDQTISAAQVDHLPIIAHYARRLGLVEIVNSLVPVEMEVEPGNIVLGLSTRYPLWTFTPLSSGKSVCTARSGAAVRSRDPAWIFQ